MVQSRRLTEDRKLRLLSLYEKYRKYYFDTYWNDLMSDPNTENFKEHTNSFAAKQSDRYSEKARQITPYTLKAMDKCGTLHTLKEFIECCENGYFIDSDGSGVYATDTEESDVAIYPSDIKHGIYRKDFTHVKWFNK